MENIDFSLVKGFEWDSGNARKNWEKHAVSPFECEEVFFNEPYFVYVDENHSKQENRFYLLGETNASRSLFIVFTIRKDKIRVISARDMSKKEKRVYEDLKKDSKIQR